MAAFGHGATHEQIAELSELLKNYPDDAALCFHLAELTFQHGDWAETLLHLTQVDQLAPEKFPTDLLRGEALLMAGKAELARQVLSRFLAVHPENLQACLQRARAAQQLGKREECLADFRAVFQRTAAPEPDLVQETADALVQYGCPDEALQVIEQGIEKLGQIPALVFHAMDLEIALRRYDSVLVRVDVMQKSASRPEPWMAKRAAVLMQAGRIVESREAWQALIRHLTALPAPQRSSHAMSKLAEEARHALASVAVLAAGPLSQARSTTTSLPKSSPQP